MVWSNSSRGIAGRAIRRYLVASGLVLNLFVLGVGGYGIYRIAQVDASMLQVANRIADGLGAYSPASARILREAFAETDAGFAIGIRDMDEYATRFIRRDAAALPDDWSDRTSRVVQVADTRELLGALREAMPGEVIVLRPGIYRVEQKRIRLGNAGRPNAPIQLTAGSLDEVVIELDSLEGFLVDKPYWVFQNLILQGACRNESECEHAFHVVGNGTHTTIRNNVITDFNSAININGAPTDGEWQYPDRGTIENNAIYNSRVRMTGNPVAAINAVAVNDWQVRGNLIADFFKTKGNRISYAGLFKGNGSGNVFDRNLVVCSLNLRQESATQVGVSFGGGGSSGGVGICRNDGCESEHSKGTIRHNVIMNCDDVGIYLNQSRLTEIYNNTLINTLGIDARYEHTNAVLANNFLTGRVRNRDGGQHEQFNDLVVDIDQITRYLAEPRKGDFDLVAIEPIVDGGIDLRETERDFCGNPRGPSNVDIGAFEYDQYGSTCNPFADGDR